MEKHGVPHQKQGFPWISCKCSLTVPTNPMICNNIDASLQWCNGWITRCWKDWSQRFDLRSSKWPWQERGNSGCDGSDADAIAAMMSMGVSGYVGILLFLSSEKYEFVSWDYDSQIFPTEWKNKFHVPNHHFVTLCIARNVLWDVARQFQPTNQIYSIR